MEQSALVLVPQPQVSIVIPTFNEEGNIIHLLEEISSALQGIQYEAVIVDDSSDATPALVESVADKFPIRLIHREGADARKGLASAVVEGFRASSGKYICVMDADLQHPPDLIPEMLASAELNCADVVVPSRYIPGGSYEGLNSPVRKAASVGLKELARAIFFPRLRGVSDPLSGFFLIRSELIRNRELHPKGFKILLEVLIRCECQTVSEIPYTFRARENGESKASMKQGLDYLKHLANLVVTVPSAGRLYKFSLVGASGVAVNLAAIAVLEQAPLELGIALIWSAAKLASIGTNFSLNRAITFRDRANPGAVEMTKEFGGFLGASSAGVLIDLALVFALRERGFSLLGAEAVAIPVAMMANFALTSRFAFRARRAPLGGNRASA